MNLLRKALFIIPFCLLAIFLGTTGISFAASGNALSLSGGDTVFHHGGGHHGGHGPHGGCWR